jgi:hypothetical protein
VTGRGPLLLGAVCVSWSLDVPACDAPALQSPAEKVIVEKQARIAWDPVAGATEYRIRLLSRVPNGRIVASHDTVVSEPHFMPPQPLAEQQAKVVVRLNALCGTQTSAESVSSFIIDTSPVCLIGELSASAAGGKAILQWPAVAGATRYEVRAYAVLDGQLLASQETRTPGAQLELKGRSAVVSVQPACSAGLGEAAYRVVTSR